MPSDKQLAEARVLELDRELRQCAKSICPKELVLELATQSQQSANLPQRPPLLSPLIVTHAIQACCAYTIPHKYQRLTHGHVGRLLEVSAACCVDDPAMAHSVRPDSNLLDFAVYMHRTQTEKQRSVGWMQLGRTAMLLFANNVADKCDAFMRNSVGVGLRDWHNMSLVIEASANKDGRRFSLSDTDLFRTLDIAPDTLRSFLGKVSCTTTDLGRSFLRQRRTHSAGRAPSPLLWMQMRPPLMSTPVLRFPEGFVVPVTEFTNQLFGRVLFTQFTRSNDEDVQLELSKRFEDYTKGCMNACMPGARIWDERNLKGNWKSADFVVATKRCIFVIECKAVMPERDYATADSMLKSGAFKAVAEGFEQVVATAQRIHAGGYHHLGLVADKPVVGLIHVLGDMPCANHNAAWDFASQLIGGHKLEDWKGTLVCRPQVFEGIAFESLMIGIHDDSIDAPTFLQEHSRSLAVGFSGWHHQVALKSSPDTSPAKAFWHRAIDLATPTAFKDT